jgi:hypothetical protein
MFKDHDITDNHKLKNNYNYTASLNDNRKADGFGFCIQRLHTFRLWAESGYEHGYKDEENGHN